MAAGARRGQTGSKVHAAEAAAAAPPRGRQAGGEARRAGLHQHAGLLRVSPGTWPPAPDERLHYEPFPAAASQPSCAPSCGPASRASPPCERGSGASGQPLSAGRLTDRLSRGARLPPSQGCHRDGRVAGGSAQAPSAALPGVRAGRRGPGAAARSVLLLGSPRPRRPPRPGLPLSRLGPAPCRRVPGPTKPALSGLGGSRLL